MKTNMYKNLLILFLLITIGCKKTEAQLEKPEVHEEKALANIVFLDRIKQFDEQKAGSQYVVDDYKLQYKNEENTFVFSYKHQVINIIDFERRDFEGVGYNIFLYDSPKSKIKTIIFEALADIGTAWYYVVLMNNNKVVKKQFIDEPRADSDKISIQKFLSIYLENSNCIFRFDKKYLARYSQIPKNIKTDNQYAYIKTSLKNPIQVISNESPIEKGIYFIYADVESIISGEQTQLKFNFYVENKEKMNLRISTNNSEDAYCEGTYKLINTGSTVKAIYNDEGICTEDKEESNFYIKKEGLKFYIKSKRFTNPDWQELIKE